MLSPSLPASGPMIAAGDKEVLLITNADLRESCNVECWPVQQRYEDILTQQLDRHFGYRVRRAHPYKNDKGHGFISSQREGSDVFARIDPLAPIIVLLTASQYSHHLAPSLTRHRGPLLLLANFEGTWPGVVGMLQMAATLHSLGRSCSRLWSPGFSDDFFLKGLDTWLRTGRIEHDLSYLHPVAATHPANATPAWAMGRQVGEFILRHKEIIGLYDSFCMGQINGVFPQKSLVDIGMPMESLSQSALLMDMARVTPALRETCLAWYEARGMKFRFGSTFQIRDLSRQMVLEQCAMLIALARTTQTLGLSAVGVQYQQGLMNCCAASDFAEGALGSSERFPIPDESGQIIRPGKPIPCINEVDMGSAIPQTMLWRLLDSLGLPAETTHHDIRCGSEFAGSFYWDLEISGAAPFEHLKGGIAGATGYRQPIMYFPAGGSTITGQGKAGRLLWCRAHYEGTQVHMHIGSGRAVELPRAEFERRRRATTYEWPLLNCTLDGVGPDDLMAGHQSNHIVVAYVDDAILPDVLRAFVAQALTQNIRVQVAGEAFDLL